MLSPALRSFHDRVYVVTHPGAIERQEAVSVELGRGNFEFVFGIDKATVTKEELIDSRIYDEELAIRTDRHGRAMTLGHVCCALGHRRAYERMIEEGCERVLIFEDDVFGMQFGEDEIEIALGNIPADAELIYWGWRGGRFRPPLGLVQQAIFHARRAVGLERFNHRMISNFYMRRYNEHFHVSSANFLLHAYTITRNAAVRLIEMNTPICLNADHAPIHAILNGDIRGYVSARQFFGQRSIDPADPVESMTQKYY